MNDTAARNIEIPTVLGTRTEIGTFFGRIRAASKLYALFQPPMAIALLRPECWNESLARVEGAYSFADGYANTSAMAKAGSRIAERALDLGLYIPALDESDLRYRVLKPTREPNWCYMRSGINLSAETPLEPYTPEIPWQTDLTEYREGGAEALPDKILWTSTQYRDWDGFAWAQDCSGGNQGGYHKSLKFPVVLVRRYEIIQ